MNKIFKSMMAMAIAAFTFTACEDVPEPYNNPYDSIKGNEPVVVDPKGSGTAEDPWNVTALLNACKGLAANEFLKINGEEATVYVKGVVVETTDISTNYKNATYYIADDKNGVARFYVFRGKMLNGADVTTATDLEVGDEVTVCGKVKNYIDKNNVSTLEFDQGNYLVSLKKANGSGNTETPDIKTVGSKDAPKTVAEALTAINSMENGATSEEYWFIKGKVKKIITAADKISQYKNIDYLITDDGNNEIKVFRGKNLDNTDFTSADQLAVDDEVVIYGQLLKYEDTKNSQIVPEVAQGNYIVKKGSGNSGNNDAVGSKETPKTVAEALTAIDAMEKGATTEQYWFVKGKVKQIITAADKISQYKNIDYLITDDGNNEIKVFRGKNMDNSDFTSADQLEVGDEVVVYGQLLKYNDTKNSKIVPEIAQGNYLVSLKKAGNNNASTGTLENPLTASQAYDAVAAMEKGKTSEADYYVKGKISSIKYTFSAQFGTATFNISDDGATGDKEFIAYSCYYFGNQPWVEGNTQVQVGDEVIVCGKVVNYNGNTPEFASKKNYLVKLNSQTAASRRK